MREWLQHWACGGEQGKDPNSGELGWEIQVGNSGNMRRCGMWSLGILEIYRQGIMWRKG